MFQTEHEFTLPMGYADGEGNLHRRGVMRLATAADEILPLEDPRVGKNPAYLLIILLARVVIKLGDIRQITPKTIEGLFAADLNYLQDFYNQINGQGQRAQPIQVECPACHHSFSVPDHRPGESLVESPGESSATP